MSAEHRHRSSRAGSRRAVHPVAGSQVAVADHQQMGGAQVGWRSILDVVTPLGWGVLDTAAVAGAIGLTTGWGEWTGLGVGLGLIFVVAVLMSLGRLAFALQLRVSDRRLVVGAPGRVAVTVRNTSRRRLLPAAMELTVSDQTFGVTIPLLPAGGTHDVILPVPTDQRAVLAIGPVRAIRGDVLGLIRRVVSWPLVEKVYVHPRTVRSGAALAGFIRDLEGAESTLRTASDLSFHSLREYVPGDDRRHIHWKKTARTGTLLVREFLETRRSTVVIVLSTDPLDYFDDEEFELAVSCAASISGDLIRAGRQVFCCVPAGDIGGIDAGSVLDRYAGLLPSPGLGSLAFSAKIAARRHANLSLMIPIFGSTISAVQVRAAYDTRPPGASVFGVRVRVPESDQPGGWLAGNTVTVPALGALPLALRQARL